MKVKNYFAAGRLKTGEMNKTEMLYARVLNDRMIVGEILWYKFEGIKLRLADNTFYTADFAAMAADNVLECHEVKALWSNGKPGFADDSKVKIKVAADIYPFRFISAAYDRKTGWQFKEF